MRHTRLAALIALMSCLGASACGSLLGVGDLPGLDAGAGSDTGSPVALDGEAIAADSAASEGAPTDGAPAKGAGGDSGAAAGEAGGASDSAVPGSTDAQAAIDAVTADVEASDAATGVCTPTATQCTSDTQVETCGPDEQWETPTTCQYVCVDDAGGACGGVCMPGAMQCSGGSVETCSSEGQWGTTTTCSGGMTCSTSLGTAACACPSGETDCSGTCETNCPGTCPAGSGLYWCAERNTCATAEECN
jgi:hypothetical protein